MYKIQTVGTWADHWVTWDHPVDILWELCFLCKMFVVLLMTLNRLPRAFPGKIKLQHFGLQLCTHSGDLQAKVNAGKSFLSYESLCHQKRNFDLISFCCIFGLIYILQISIFKKVLWKIFIACYVYALRSHLHERFLENTENSHIRLTVGFRWISNCSYHSQSG